jgi:hypothetical protein
VHIDKAGRDHATIGLDGAAGGASIADLHDASVVDGDIGHPGWSAESIDELAPTDDKVVHDKTSLSVYRTKVADRFVGNRQIIYLYEGKGARTEVTRG